MALARTTSRKLNRVLAAAAFAVVVTVLVGHARAGAGEQADAPGNVVVFPRKPLQGLQRRDPHVQYDFDLRREAFFVHAPAGYDRSAAYGLVVYVGAGSPRPQLPDGWGDVLARRRLLFIAPYGADNEQPLSRRCGLAVVAALKAMETSNVDPDRVYVAGFSGGARVANAVAFYHPELFRGTIQSCGAEFHEPVEQTHPLSPQALQLRSQTGPYGQAIDPTPEQVALAKRNVRFVLVTSPDDFRAGEIRDIFENGYRRAVMDAKLIDVPGLGHNLCDGRTFDDALAFIERAR